MKAVCSLFRILTNTLIFILLPIPCFQRQFSLQFLNLFCVLWCKFFLSRQLGFSFFAVCLVTTCPFTSHFPKICWHPFSASVSILYFFCPFAFIAFRISNHCFICMLVFFLFFSSTNFFSIWLYIKKYCSFLYTDLVSSNLIKLSLLFMFVSLEFLGVSYEDNLIGCI